MRGRTITGRKALAGHNESSSVGAPVEEELDEHVDGKHGVAGQVVIGETPDDEEDGEESESDQLEGLATNGVDGSHGEPVSRDGTGTGEDSVTGSKVVQLMVSISATSIADGLKDGRSVQTKSIEGNVE